MIGRLRDVRPPAGNAVDLCGAACALSADVPPGPVWPPGPGWAVWRAGLGRGCRAGRPRESVSPFGHSGTLWAQVRHFPGHFARFVHGTCARRGGGYRGARIPGPLQQPGFASEVAYSLRHGIPSMTEAEFGQLRAVTVPKRVVVGVDDPQMSASDAPSRTATAWRRTALLPRARLPCAASGGARTRAGALPTVRCNQR
jgi:hypothetical protein